ncbi:unnamed protein product [Bursaphelenchus okinawaensis]|uniref:DNA replication licensing factor MCM3 n=1 Tax=Bursaphelenchus okinawaensis TaxID=465554 RepID=A0A811LJN5_9BILA|nr:unnamed protein product [Bursaphelenchus okinawaensis]CAG9123176.1 unnamed protein product [Bursaphelenchus okinawaensis]
MTDHNLGLTDINDELKKKDVYQEYVDYIDDKDDVNFYGAKIEEMIRAQGKRLIINLNDLRERLSHRLQELVVNFAFEIQCLEEAVRTVVNRTDAEFASANEVHVGFEGSFGDRHVNPRSLKSDFLGNLVCCEGIVTRCSSVKPKIVKSVHYCPATNKSLTKTYTDLTNYNSFPSSNVYPKEDENKNPLETEFGLSMFKDHQIFAIQELPETAPPGQLPRSVDVIADGDLADSCKPGDRIRVVGLFRVLPNKQQGASSGNFRTILIANNVILLSKESSPKFDQQDVKNISRLSKRKDIVDLLARSLAPSIYGHEEVKKAVLCLLLGGCEKILENGSRLRGDVNVLLIGDPSVAKSQILRYVLHTAPRAIATTGRGSSGVGLTAAVTTDSDTGDRRLEAGAMVLADRGVVCIDEFDKMTDIDRTAIHEVMEQGRVSISKAGIHAKLNARCSVLAAANPVYGRYDLFKSPMANIGMQDSLLSRFDLIFVMLDEHDIDRDTRVASNVLKLHRYRSPGEPDGAVLSIQAAVESLTTFEAEVEESTVDIYEKNRGWTAVNDIDKILTTGFLRKYVHMAKSIKPQLTEQASAYITECYTELRSYENDGEDRTMPVTARQLETLIRLSIAMTKARLGTKVEKSDAEKAFNLLHFAMFKKKPKERTDKKKREADQSDGEEMEVVQEQRSTRRRRAAEDAGDRQDEEEQNQEAPASKRARNDDGVGVDRFVRFKQCLRVAFDETENPEGMHPMTTIVELIQKQMGQFPFTESELKASFELLEAENVCMISDDQVVLV